jgi:hypothetical protein
MRLATKATHQQTRALSERIDLRPIDEIAAGIDEIVTGHTAIPA